MGLIKLITNQSQQPIDVIALQEVTPHALKTFHAQLASTYEFSPFPNDAPYFTVILARKSLLSSYAIKFARVPFRTSVMGRDLLLLDLFPRRSSSSTPAVTIGCVHLESESRTQERLNQTRAINELLRTRTASRVLIGGDFNFDDLHNYPMRRLPKEQLENDALRKHLPEFTDLWPRLKGESDRGLTFDHAYSKHWTGKSFGSLKARYDRVLARGRDPGEDAGSFVRGIEIFANVPVGKTPDGHDLYASDHFGVLVEFDAGGGGDVGAFADAGREAAAASARSWETAKRARDDGDAVVGREKKKSKQTAVEVVDLRDSDGEEEEVAPAEELDPKEMLRRRRLAWIDRLPSASSSSSSS